MLPKLYIQIKRFFSMLNIINTAIWLSILDRSSLGKLNNFQYSKMGKYSDSSYNMSGLYNWEKKTINKYFNDCKTILVPASGGGREIIALSNMNIKVTGFECCEKLVNSCKFLLKSKNIDSNIVLSNPNDIPDNLGTFDGIVFGWGAYIHIPGSESRIEFLKKLREHLKEGNPLLISFLVRDVDSKYFQRTYKVSKFINKILFRNRNIEIGDDLNTTFDHFFIESEILHELRSAKFNLIYYNQDDEYPYAVARAV